MIPKSLDLNGNASENNYAINAAGKDLIRVMVRETFRTHGEAERRHPTESTGYTGSSIWWEVPYRLITNLGLGHLDQCMTGV